MLGAIIGDIAGSRFQVENRKSKNFVIFHKESYITDDSLMSIAICKAILECRGDYSHLGEFTIKWMREIGRKYPEADYGSRFREWIFSPTPHPYNSLGNGSAMRVSGVGYIASSVYLTRFFAKKVSEVTHNHQEGIKGGESVAIAIYMARSGRSKEEIKDYISRHYYPITLPLDDIRPDYVFDVTCEGSVPVAFEAFYEAKSFEDSIRLAISVGGDSDTIGAIAGSIAEAYYGIPPIMREKALTYLDDYLKEIVLEFEEKFPPKIAG